MLTNYTIPPILTTSTFIARKLCARDNDLDYAAWHSSIDIIRKTRGGNWPTEDMTKEENMIDLSWHQREFEYKSSFAYTVMNLDETECLGCFYIYPFGEGMSSTIKPDGEYDIEVSWWVTQKMYDKGFYEELETFVKNFVEKTFPDLKVYYANIIQNLN